MPFDGTDFPQVSELDKIDRVINYLSSPDRWCKGVLETADGRRCLMGALRAADAQSLEPLIRRSIAEVTGRRCWSVAAFNDAATTTHGKVMRVLDHARHDIGAGYSTGGGGRSVRAWCRSLMVSWRTRLAAS